MKEFIKKNWICTVLIICFAIIIFCLGVKVSHLKKELNNFKSPEIQTQETKPVITHNPTDETRNLGTDWLYDEARGMRFNSNVPIHFCVDGQNYTFIQWYIVSDHVSPASNYWGVTGANSETLTVTARTDMSGFGVYAVLSDDYGNTAQTSVAYMYITSTDIPVTYSITYTNCIGDYSFASVNTPVTVTVPAENYKIDVYNSDGVCIASGANTSKFTFNMPFDSVYVVATII